MKQPEHFSYTTCLLATTLYDKTLYVSIIKTINDRQDSTVQWVSIKSLKTEILEATPHTVTITTFFIKAPWSKRLQLPEVHTAEG